MHADLGALSDVGSNHDAATPSLDATTNRLGQTLTVLRHRIDVESDSAITNEHTDLVALDLGEKIDFLLPRVLCRVHESFTRRTEERGERFLGQTVLDAFAFELQTFLSTGAPLGSGDAQRPPLRAVAWVRAPRSSSAGA